MASSTLRSARFGAARLHWSRLSRESYWARFILAAVACGYLFPVLVGGRVLVPNSFLFFFAPWASHAPASFHVGLNPLLSDIPSAYYPWNFFAREMLDSGRFPAWNPYAFSGTPFYANPQTALLSPFSVPMWLLPLNFGLGVAALLKLWVAGWGTYSLTRWLGLDPWPSVLAGLTFMLCGFMILWLEYETLPAAAAMLPWAILLADRTLTRRRVGDVVALALVTVVLILAGQPEIAVQSLVAVAVYILVRALSAEDGTARERAKRLALPASALCLGVLLSAVWLLPVLKAGLGTPGADALQRGGFPLPWSAVRTLLFPGWWSRFHLGGAPLDIVERTCYVGVIPLMFAGLATLSGSHVRKKLPFIALSLLGLALAFRVPGLSALAEHIPGLDNTQFGRLLLWPQLGIAVLAAFGLQQFVGSFHERRAALFVAGAVIAITLVVAAAQDPTLHQLRSVLNHFRTGTDYTSPKLVALISVVWAFGFAVLGSHDPVGSRQARVSATGRGCAHPGDRIGPPALFEWV